MYWLYFVIYIVIINLIGFIIMKIDKEKAKKRLYRISEKTIFTIAILGGALGVWAGMFKFRHKTKHYSFLIGVPFCFAVDCLILYFVYSYFIV